MNGVEECRKEFAARSSLVHLLSNRDFASDLADRRVQEMLKDQLRDQMGDEWVCNIQNQDAQHNMDFELGPMLPEPSALVVCVFRTLRRLQLLFDAVQVDVPLVFTENSGLVLPKLVQLHGGTRSKPGPNQFRAGSNVQFHNLHVREVSVPPESDRSEYDVNNLEAQVHKAYARNYAKAAADAAAMQARHCDRDVVPNRSDAYDGGSAGDADSDTCSSAEGAGHGSAGDADSDLDSSVEGAGDGSAGGTDTDTDSSAEGAEQSIESAAEKSAAIDDANSSAEDAESSTGSAADESAEDSSADSSAEDAESSAGSAADESAEGSDDDSSAKDAEPSEKSAADESAEDNGSAMDHANYSTCDEDSGGDSDAEAVLGDNH